MLDKVRNSLNEKFSSEISLEELVFLLINAPANPTKVQQLSTVVGISEIIGEEETEDLALKVLEGDSEPLVAVLVTIIEDDWKTSAITGIEDVVYGVVAMKALQLGDEDEELEMALQHVQTARTGYDEFEAKLKEHFPKFIKEELVDELFEGLVANRKKQQELQAKTLEAQMMAAQQAEQDLVSSVSDEVVADAPNDSEAPQEDDVEDTGGDNVVKLRP